MSLTRLVSKVTGMGGDGGRAFRRKRFSLFVRLLDAAAVPGKPCRILDLGGEPDYWDAVQDLMGDRPYHITLVNLSRYPVDSSRFTSIEGDARHLPDLADQSFDIVHSNSVIEHVGRWDDMAAMAREIRRLAPGYFVQTPYYWFPVEPHCSTAFFHWVPEAVRLRMLMRKPRGAWGQAPDVPGAMRQIQSNNLLDFMMMRTLFPDATVYPEKIFGLTKSMIAVRLPGPVQSPSPAGAAV